MKDEGTVAQNGGMAAGVALFERVLFVEDDPAHALLLERAIRPLCRELQISASYSAAKQLLAELHPDLIVSDLNLPDSKSHDHIAWFVSSAPHVPVVVLTSSTSVQDAVGAMQLGASDYIVKAFTPDLHERIKLALTRVAVAARLARERQQLEREMTALRAAIENSDDGLAVIDGAGKVEYANSAFRVFAARTQGSSLQIQELFGEGVTGAAAVRNELERHRGTLSAGSAWRTEVRLSKEPDDAYELILSVVGEDQAQGATLSVIWIRSIAEEKRRERFQREIISTTTHDLKGPLGAILISAELLQEPSTSRERALDIALRISSSAQSAINLIDEFLSARRIQEGTFILRPVQHNLKELLDEAIANFIPVAASRSIALTVHADSNLSINADRLGLLRVMGNLLSNALKFTNKGGSVTVEAIARDDEVVLRVTDTGSGMDPADVQKLFQRFSRLDRHREIAGTGLGLFVVRSIVSAHGGRIAVTSKVGKGTSFEMTFPSAPPVNERGEIIVLSFA